MATLEGDFNRPCGPVEVRDGKFFFAGDGIEWSSIITEHKSGVKKRVDTIKNTSDRVIDIRNMLSKFIFEGGEYEVYTQYNEWCGEGYGKWQELVTEISAEGESCRSITGASPFVAVYSNQSQRGMVFHILCDGLWMFKVKRFYLAGVNKTVEVELGLLGRSLNYHLMPGEEFTLPTILFYEFKNKVDMDAYKLHRYANDVYPAKSIPVMYNSWLSKFDNISPEILSVQLEKAKEIGAEYFIIDAGWFGPPGEWGDAVGDWEECTHASMGGRMKEFADSVRASGLKFGLWFEPERAGAAAKGLREHPEYYLYENGWHFLNFAVDEACDYIYEKVASNIRNFGIEFIKFDFNAELTFDRTSTAFVNYFKGYRKFLMRLREEFPDLYLECCAGGGTRMCFANLNGFDSFWMSDNHSIYKQMEIFKNTLIRLPSRSLEKWVSVQSIKDFQPVNSPQFADPVLSCGEAAWRHLEGVTRDYMFAAMLGGPVGLTCDLTRLSDGLLNDFKEFIKQYKADREFWMNSECHILCDTESMLVLQFNDEQFNKIKIASFSKMPLQYFINIYPITDGSGCYSADNGLEYDAKVLENEGVFLPVEDRFRASMITFNKK